MIKENLKKKIKNISPFCFVFMSMINQTATKKSSVKNLTKNMALNFAAREKVQIEMEKNTKYKILNLRSQKVCHSFTLPQTSVHIKQSMLNLFLYSFACSLIYNNPF